MLVEPKISDFPEGYQVRFRDLKPYWIVDSLDDLRGPYSGTITLSHNVRWLGDRHDIPVDSDGSRTMAYQALLSEGTDEEQACLLNKKRLLESWSQLRMDERVRSLWESRFPALAMG